MAEHADRLRGMETRIAAHGAHTCLGATRTDDRFLSRVTETRKRWTAEA